ncbi:hypothetical protein B0H14DRAFT_2929676, partial [Mycena olivaceomarginata]
MKAPIQCLSATLPFAQFFASELNAVNTVNPLGSKGLLSGAFAKLVYSMKTICHLNSQYNGSNQHGSQEFLSFLLDGIHEDLPARTNSGASDGKMNGLHDPKHKRGDMDRQ